MQKPGWKTLVLTVAVDYVAAMYLIVSKLDGTDIALVSIPALIEAIFGWRIGDHKLRPAYKADRAKIQNELDAARSQEVAVGLRWNIAGSAYGENSTSISIATGTHLSSQVRGLWLAQSLAGHSTATFEQRPGHYGSGTRRLLPSLLTPHQPKSYKDTGDRVEPSIKRRGSLCLESQI
jgi:hypothetical protein